MIYSRLLSPTDGRAGHILLGYFKTLQTLWLPKEYPLKTATMDWKLTIHLEPECSITRCCSRHVQPIIYIGLLYSGYIVVVGLLEFATDEIACQNKRRFIPTLNWQDNDANHGSLDLATKHFGFTRTFLAYDVLPE